MQELLTFIFRQDTRGDCISDSDCEYLFECSANNLCEHVSILEPTMLQILGYSLIFIIIGFSTVGGLGGGIEKVPILMVLLNYSQKTATFYTYALMLGANFSNFFMLVPQRHPHLDRPIIDYNIALILLPTNLFGSALGTMLNKMLPDILLLIVFILLMFGLTTALISRTRKEKEPEIKKSLLKVFQESIKESIKGSIYEQEVDSASARQKLIEADKTYANAKKISTEAYGDFLAEDQKKSSDDQVPENPCFIPFHIVHNFNARWKRGGIFHWHRLLLYLYQMKQYTVYWIFTGIIALLLGLLTFINKWLVTTEQDKMIQCGYFSDEYDIRYSWEHYLKIWSAGIVGGVMGGMLGVGSGSLMVPLLILFDINPRIAAATSGFSKLFISAATVFLAYLEGDLSSKEIGFFVTLGILGGLLLSSFIYYFVFKYKKQSMINYIVAGFLVLNIISAVSFIIKETVIFDRWDILTQTFSYC